MTETIRIPLGPSGAPVAWTTIDAIDYERLIIHRWYLSGRGYAFRTKDHRSVFMHREVLEFPDSEAINHINGDQLDNRRLNLEACTQKHNSLVGDAATVFPMRDRIRELRLAGKTNRTIALELGISKISVARYASDLPRAPHPNYIWTKERLIEWTVAFRAAHGRIPAGREYDGQNGNPWFTSVYREFAGLKELRAAAGLGPVDLRRPVST